MLSASFLEIEKGISNSKCGLTCFYDIGTLEDLAFKPSSGDSLSLIFVSFLL